MNDEHVLACLQTTEFHLRHYSQNWDNLPLKYSIPSTTVLRETVLLCPFTPQLLRQMEKLARTTPRTSSTANLRSGGCW